MNEGPLVSIVTPAYNRASFLDETIQSVLTQDYPNVEYIVLDDGSTDNTGDVLHKYDGRIIWQSHPNMGETLTVNKGWSMAHGEIVAVVNSDDPLMPGAVTAAVAFMQSHPDVLVAYPDWDFIDAQSKTIQHMRVREYDYAYMVSHHYCAPGPGAFVRGRAFQLTHMRDPEFRYVADFEYWLRLGMYGPFKRIPKTLATFRVHSESASVAARGRAMAEEHIRLIRKLYSHPDMPKSLRGKRSQAFCWAHLAAAFVSGPAQAAKFGHLFKALLCNPPAFSTALTYFGIGKMASFLHIALPEPLYGVLRSVWRRSAFSTGPTATRLINR